MADYQKMYLELFNEVTRAVEILQEAQKHAEERFIATDNAVVLQADE